MSETPQEAVDVHPQTAGGDVSGTSSLDEPAEPATDTPTLDADGDPVKPFGITGTFEAEDQHDAYKLLQAHFLALSRGDAGTLDGVQVQVA